MTLLTVIAGCRAKPSEAHTATLRVSMIPTTDPGKMARDSAGLVSYLEKELAAHIELTVPLNYAAVVEAIAADQVDIAYLGGFTFVQAQKRAGVIPVVQRERDQNFHSLFITQPDSPIASLKDLEAHSFAFGDVNSTSGHLMPEYFMRKEGISPAVIGKAIYTGGHDATALAVANKRVDAGALDEAVFQQMTTLGKLDVTKVKVFYTTPPFFDYVWAARKGLEPQRVEAFKAAFLKLTPANSSDKPILELLQATKYVQANNESYDRLREAAVGAGLLR
ncbi:MAG: putative selenate ABC transporter substrate-binding protein [Polyangiales bacterium]